MFNFKLLFSKIVNAVKVVVNVIKKLPVIITSKIVSVSAKPILEKILKKDPEEIADKAIDYIVSIKYNFANVRRQEVRELIIKTLKDKDKLGELITVYLDNKKVLDNIAKDKDKQVIIIKELVKKDNIELLLANPHEEIKKYINL